MREGLLSKSPDFAGRPRYGDAMSGSAPIRAAGLEVPVPRGPGSADLPTEEHAFGLDAGEMDAGALDAAEVGTDAAGPDEQPLGGVDDEGSLLDVLLGSPRPDAPVSPRLRDDSEQPVEPSLAPAASIASEP